MERPSPSSRRDISEKGETLFRSPGSGFTFGAERWAKVILVASLVRIEEFILIYVEYYGF